MEVHNAKKEDFCMEVVSEDSTSFFSAFSCGNAEIDKYFREEAQHDMQNVCYAYRNKANNDVVGAAAVCCSGINFGNENSVQLIPAIKIDYFAVSEKYQGINFPGAEEECFHVSDAFLCDLIREISTISEFYIGAAYILLYSVPGAFKFYDRNHFEKFEDYMKPESRLYLEGCIPMYMPLH